MSAEAKPRRKSAARVRRGLVRVAPTILARTVLIVLASEFFVHVILHQLIPSARVWGALVDTFLLLLLIAAPLYWLVFRPVAELAGQAAALTAEPRFRALLESAPDGVVVIDAKGRIVLVNAQAERMFGFSRAELLGQPVEVLVPERLRGAHVQHHRTYFSKPSIRGMGAGLDLVGLRKDGNEFSADISLSPLETEEGLLVTSVIRDITERKQAEEQLRRSAERFRQMLEALPVAIRVVQNGVVVFCNSAAALLHGCEGPEEIIGTDAVVYFAEEDVPRLRDYAARRAAGDLSVPNRYELRAKRLDGSVVPVEMVVARILYGGKPASLAALYDLSERKRVQLYESILPVCCVCGKVRDDTDTKPGKGPWRSLEAFVTDHTDTNLSHTFCPICYQEYRRQQGLPPDAA